MNFESLKKIIEKELNKINDLNLDSTSEELSELHYILENKYWLNVECNQRNIDLIVSELLDINIY